MLYRPWTARTFGVEFEIIRRSTHSVNLRNALRPVVGHALGNRTGYFHSDGHTWDVKTDSTCGWEVATPALWLDPAGKHPVMEQALSAIVNDAGGRVGPSCGAHVHLDCSDYSWEDLQRLLRLWTRYEPFFYELIPANRRESVFCVPLRTNRWDAETGLYWGRVQRALTATDRHAFTDAAIIERRVSLNCINWWRTGVVEVRLYPGTLDYEEIRHWVMLMAAVMNRVRAPGMPEIRAAVTPTNIGSLPTDFICRQIGLLPSRGIEVPDESLELVRWVEAVRRRRNRRRAEPNMEAVRQRFAPPPLNNPLFPQTNTTLEPVDLPEQARRYLPDEHWLEQPETPHPMIDHALDWGLRSDGRSLHRGGSAVCCARNMNCAGERDGDHNLCPTHLREFRTQRPYSALPRLDGRPWRLPSGDAPTAATPVTDPMTFTMRNGFSIREGPIPAIGDDL